MVLSTLDTLGQEGIMRGHAVNKSRSTILIPEENARDRKHEFQSALKKIPPYFNPGISKKAGVSSLHHHFTNPLPAHTRIFGFTANISTFFRI